MTDQPKQSVLDREGDDSLQSAKHWLLRELDPVRQSIERFLVPQGSRAVPTVAYRKGRWRVHFQFEQGFPVDWVERHLDAWAHTEGLKVSGLRLHREGFVTECRFQVRKSDC